MSCYCHYQCHVEVHLRSIWQPIKNDCVASHAVWRGIMEKPLAQDGSHVQHMPRC